MKIDKQVQKKCVSTIKEIAAKTGYKKIQNTIYKMENGNVIFVDFLIVDSIYLIYRINIKKQSYDKIFWQIMRMEENLKRSDSLRVNGAFAAPHVLVAKGKIELSENVDIIANYFLEKISEETNSFLEKYDVTQYIFSNNDEGDADILQCLSYIDSGLLSKAKEPAQKQILLGNTGRFENEGKGFFELVVLYND
ncbi:MAG: hypothetical protein J6K04_04195 [Lachnospiraceae bacterium]|nr:hypothetical protein [Lachnospiraceae bacterium]